jgi:alkanesulfonate monooxygenase SsuD/methylene tetrahydromethanopterin reductase-like flavin-dependent oxidoreductase (luciferase family)
MARYGIGWTAGGAGPEAAKGAFEQARDAWRAAGREGEPRLWALVYFALGDSQHEVAEGYLTEYYGDWGPGMAAAIPKDTESVRATAKAFAEAGTETLLWVPTSSDLGQLDLLAEALGGRTTIEA